MLGLLSFTVPFLHAFDVFFFTPLMSLFFQRGSCSPFWTGSNLIYSGIGYLAVCAYEPEQRVSTEKRAATTRLADFTEDLILRKLN